ncbi:MAG: hypothetical protein ACFFCS_29345, partial [Candidatus Hodarchaeota archaeon]
YGVRFTPLEKIYHDNKIPISWMIDPPVAEKMADNIIKWAADFGDTYSILPTSYFRDNAVNYNLDKSFDEALKLLQVTWLGVLEAFKKRNFPRYANVGGVDQWLGSIGSNFVKAALDIGLLGLWGMGWDHEKHDTSMFHRGAPWNAYKPSKYQFRIPIQENERHELFLFQWTVRELVNTLHLSPFGSEIFSTDPDDLRSNGIIKQVEPHFMIEILYNYLKNMKYNDYFVFLIHQEDHDAHYDDGNQFLKKFIEFLNEDKPPGITFATLDEVAQWLAIKYPDNDVPTQILELEDPLSPPLREYIKEKHFMKILQVYDPEEDEEVERIMVEHFPTSKLPTHVAFFNRNLMFIGYKPHHLPIQIWNYSQEEKWNIPEDGQYPLTILPKITLLDEKSDGSYQVSLISNKFFSNLPWIVWNPSFKLKSNVKKEIAFQTKKVVVFFINVKIGKNHFNFEDLMEK